MGRKNCFNHIQLYSNLYFRANAKDSESNFSLMASQSFELNFEWTYVFEKYFQLSSNLFGLISEGTQRVILLKMVLRIGARFVRIDFRIDEHIKKDRRSGLD